MNHWHEKQCARCGDLNGDHGDLDWDVAGSCVRVVPTQGEYLDAIEALLAALDRSAARHAPACTIAAGRQSCSCGLIEVEQTADALLMRAGRK